MAEHFSTVQIPRDYIARHAKKLAHHYFYLDLWHASSTSLQLENQQLKKR